MLCDTGPRLGITEVPIKQKGLGQIWRGDKEGILFRGSKFVTRKKKNKAWGSENILAHEEVHTKFLMTKFSRASRGP